MWYKGYNFAPRTNEAPETTETNGGRGFVGFTPCAH